MYPNQHYVESSNKLTDPLCLDMASFHVFAQFPPPHKHQTIALHSTLYTLSRQALVVHLWQVPIVPKLTFFLKNWKNISQRYLDIGFWKTNELKWVATFAPIRKVRRSVFDGNSAYPFSKKCDWVNTLFRTVLQKQFLIIRLFYINFQAKILQMFSSR